MFKVFKTSINIGYYGLAFMHGLIFGGLLLTCFLIYGGISASNFYNLKESQINYIADVLFYFLSLTLFVGSLIPIEYANTKRGIMKVYTMRKSIARPLSKLLFQKYTNSRTRMPVL